MANDNLMQEIADLQTKYKDLIDNKCLTKRAMCDLCIPFRDTHNLTDLQTLQIARSELTIAEILTIFEIGGTNV